MSAIPWGEISYRVQLVQRKLLAHGYALPKYKDDRELGMETFRAGLRFARDHKIPWKNYKQYKELPEDVEQAILSKPVEEKMVRGMIDVTDDHPLYNAYNNPRQLKDVTAIVLHQTACHMGNKPKRWHELPAHIGIPSDGIMIYVNKFNVVCWHANWFNRFSVGIEIDGNFRGLENRDNTRWTPGGRKSTLTSAQIVSCKDTIIWICSEISKHGGQVTDILAHRQTSKSRQGDPGSAIWQQIGLWAQSDLGLKNDPLYVRGSGLTIPEEWDHRGIHDYWGAKTKRAIIWYQRALNIVMRRDLGADQYAKWMLSDDGDHGKLTSRRIRWLQTNISGAKISGRVGRKERNYLERVLTLPTIEEWKQQLARGGA